MKLVEVAGYNIKTPTTYYPAIEIIENSQRNTKGTLIRELIAEKIKINMSWNYMTQQELAQLQSVRKLKEFECSYWDSETSEIKTILCYCGPVTATPIRADENGIVDWRDITANFIEL